MSQLSLIKIKNNLDLMIRMARVSSAADMEREQKDRRGRSMGTDGQS